MLGWSKNRLGNPQIQCTLHKLQCITSSCNQWEFPLLSRGHWQSQCTALTLANELCKETTEQSRPLASNHIGTLCMTDMILSAQCLVHTEDHLMVWYIRVFLHWSYTFAFLLHCPIDMTFPRSLSNDYPIGHVSQAAIIGITKMASIIRSSHSNSFEDRVSPDLQMNCSNLTKMIGYQDCSSINGHQATCPVAQWITKLSWWVINYRVYLMFNTTSSIFEQQTPIT